MDLKNFISESLYQIIAGVKAAQERITELSGDNAPSNKAYIVPMAGPDRENDQHDIHFDVALTVSKDESAQSSAQVLVLGLSSFSDKVPIGRINSLVSRIQFSVPVIYPAMNKQKLSSASFPHWH